MSEKRVLHVNLESFKIPDNTRKKKPKNEMPKIKMNIGHNKVKSIRRNVMKMVRARQQEDYAKIFSEKGGIPTAPVVNPDENKIKSELAESVEFLSSLAKKEKVPFYSSNNSNVQMGKTLKHNNIQPIPPNLPVVPVLVTNVYDQIQPTGVPSLSPILGLPKYSSIPDPPHGCMKYGGKKLTYRNWNTQKNNGAISNVPYAPSAPSVPSAQPSTIEEWRKKHRGGAANQDSLRREIQIKKEKYKLKTSDANKNKNKQKLRQYKRRKIFKRTYKVGRHKTRPQIGVLVSNRTIRNNITTQCQLLKQTPIQEVKKTLIKKGLIKIGTLAPNEVLRKMYETVSMVCGEVQNHNSENMLYNYIHGA